MEDVPVEKGLISPGMLAQQELGGNERYMWFVSKADAVAGPNDRTTSASYVTDESLSLFKVGDRVMGNYKNCGSYYPGKIAAIYPDSTYHIKYNDGDEEKRTPLARISLMNNGDLPRTFYTKHFRGIEWTELDLASPVSSLQDWTAVDVTADETAGAKDLPPSGYFGLHLKRSDAI